MFKKIKTFLKGLFWEKTDLILQIEALQALLQSREEKGPKKPSVEEHLHLLQQEVKQVESQLVSSGGEIDDSEQLLSFINQMPGLVEESIKVHEMRSEYSEKEFTAKIARYMEQICPLLSNFCQKIQQSDRKEYIRIRRAIGKFMTKYGDWGICMGTNYQLQMLFESDETISLRTEGSHLGMTTSSSGLVTSFRVAVQMLNEGNIALSSKTYSKTW